MSGPDQDGQAQSHPGGPGTPQRARRASRTVRHEHGDIHGVGSGYAPPQCPADRHDGRCQVTLITGCRVRHKHDHGEPCGARATHCVRHGWRWKERPE